MVLMRRRFRFEQLEARSLLAALASGEVSHDAESLDTQVMASIDVDQLQRLRAVAVEISFDRDRLQLDDLAVRAGSAWGGKGLAIANVDNEQGKANIFIFSARETLGASGSLVELDFQRNTSDDDRPWQIELENLRVNDGEIAIHGQAGRLTMNASKSTPAKVPLKLMAAGEGESSDSVAAIEDASMEIPSTDQDALAVPLPIGELETALDQVMTDFVAVHPWIDWLQESQRWGAPTQFPVAALDSNQDTMGASVEQPSFCVPEYSGQPPAWLVESPLPSVDPTFIGPVVAPMLSQLETSNSADSRSIEHSTELAMTPPMPAGNSQTKDDDSMERSRDALGVKLIEAQRIPLMLADWFVTQKKSATSAWTMGYHNPHDGNRTVFDEYHLAPEVVRGKLSSTTAYNRVN